MNKKKSILLCAALALLAAVAVAVYAFSDREPPQITAVDSYWVECGNAVTVEELAARIEDQSSYTVKLYGEGTVAEDGQSITFDKIGTFQVTIEATDAKGHSAQKTVPVTARDKTPPVLTVKTLKATVGSEINYQKAVKAVDAVDGDLSDAVEVDTHYVNHKAVGRYTAVYSVQDRSGNRAEARGQVIVQPVKAKSIQLDRTELYLNGNQYATLTATVNPEKWAGMVTWSSSDPAVATVSDGLVTWIAPGKCTITAKADQKKAQCTVTCGAVAATSVRLNRYSVTLHKGEMTILEAESSPTNWKGEITWESSNPKVAKVKDGVVTAVKPGKCQIKAKAGSVEAACQVTCLRKTVGSELKDIWDELTEGPTERNDTDEKKPAKTTKKTKAATNKKSN